MDTKAIAKLDELIWDNTTEYPSGFDIEADKILAAIQAAPLSYVKPKPLEWDGIYAKTVFGAYYQILESRSGKSWCVQIVFKDGSHTICYAQDREAAQAAAYDDLCNRVKELF